MRRRPSTLDPETTIASSAKRGAGRGSEALTRRGRLAVAVGLLGAIVSASLANASPATFDCVIEASLNVKLGSPVASIIADVAVDRGDAVKRGQVVAHMESAVEEAVVAYNKARADSTAEIEAKQAVLDQKTGILNRKLGLEQQRVASSQDVENAQADFNVAKQELALARLNHQMAEIEFDRSRAELAQRTIRSPIDGIVTQRSLGPGEYVHQEATIVSIARIDPLNVEAYLPVSYYKLINVGDVAIVRPSDPIGGDREAKVSVVDQVFDAASGTFGVRLVLANPGNAVPAGLRCRVTFDLAAPPAGANP
jgi:RND family efflux transporter MFP subunit